MSPSIPGPFVSKKTGMVARQLETEIGRLRDEPEPLKARDPVICKNTIHPQPRHFRGQPSTAPDPTSGPIKVASDPTSGPCLHPRPARFSLLAVPERNSYGQSHYLPWPTWIA